MKSFPLLVLACLSLPAFAQTLPDEINYSPYETTYRNLGQEVIKEEAALKKSRADLVEIKRFIAEMTQHLSSLESSIVAADARIQNNQQQIPELDRRITASRNEQSRNSDEIRRLQAIETQVNFRYQQELTNLRAIEVIVSRREQRVREMQIELQGHQRHERDALARLNVVQRELSLLEKQIADEKNLQHQLGNDLRTIDSRVAAQQIEVTRAEALVATVKSQLTTEQGKLPNLEARVVEARTELEALKTQGAPKEQIRDAQRKLSAVTDLRDKTVHNIKQLEAQVGSAERQYGVSRAKVEEIKKEKETLPVRIAQSDAREKQLTVDRNAKLPLLARFEAEHRHSARTLDIRSKEVSVAIEDLRLDQANMVRQRQHTDNVGNELQGLRNNVNALAVQNQNLRRDEVEMGQLIGNLQLEIPKLQTQITASRKEIAEGTESLKRAITDESNLAQSITIKEEEVSRLTEQRNSAQEQMSQRLALYNRYLVEAKSAGAAQAQKGSELGERDALAISLNVASKNATSIGKELGLAEARHWGHVRGEIQGFDIGYAEGLSSQEDQSRGRLEGDNRGKQDAHIFAQANFKPVFFEEFVLEEFKRPLALRVQLKSMKMNFQKNSDNFVSSTIEPLSESELQRSAQLVTALDESIANQARDVEALTNKSRELANGATAYVIPTTIPVGTANCSQVYKNLAVFKASCEASYKATFSENYLNTMKLVFINNYSEVYEGILSDVNNAEREKAFPAQFDTAAKVGKSHGIKTGKEEIYKKSFALAYRASYDLELPLAREKAKFDAGVELSKFLAVSPLLTLTDGRLVAENFRGGESVRVLSNVKNVAKVAFNGAAVIRITQVENAVLQNGAAVLNTAPSLSVTAMPELIVKVSPTAKAGQRVVVRGVVELPGDLYRSQRQEKFEFSEVLSANPAVEKVLDYNKTPQIKGIWRRMIHFMDISVAPKIEDLAKGYSVSLKAIGENAALININEGSIETGALKQSQAKNVRYSYTFPDTAKNKTVSLQLAVSYEGKVIATELIELNPR